MENQQIKSSFFLFLKGVAMGMGDSVPGVSGGTIAVITNIYERLINAIKQVDVTAVQLLFKGKIKALWLHVDGNFLVLLASGILLGLLVSANTVLFLLEAYFEPLMGFFVGLVLVSVYFLHSQANFKNVNNIGMLVLGVILAVLVSNLPPQELGTEYFSVFLAGAVAICAMILPGLSGAFILLILGMYEFILKALTEFQVDYIVVFVAGCAIGLLTFSRLLSWLLTKYHGLTYGFISGLLLGSLAALWPWQIVTLSYIDDAGESHALTMARVLPQHYLEQSGTEPRVLLTIIALSIGMILVYSLHGLSQASSAASEGEL